LKAASFRYVKASSLDEVYEELSQYGDDARILAGGQSLIPALNMRLSAPAVLIDINRLTELSGIRISGEVARIGALTRHRTVERSAEIRQHAPLLAQALPHVAHPAIRNRGTLGGSLAFADPAAELPACCVALNGKIVLASHAGERRVPARNFFTGLYETDLKPDEVITAVEVPIQQPDQRSTFAELARRHGDYAIAGIAARAAFSEGRFSDVSIVFFGVGDVPVSAPALASILTAGPYSEKVLESVSAAVAHDVKPDADVYHSGATKLHLAQTLAVRAVATLARGPDAQ
jgi:carbon-monoxide dehydrogenase medium subunit